MNYTRTLANGEVWELRGDYWYMIEPKEDFSPVSMHDFGSYVRTIEAYERRLRELKQAAQAWDDKDLKEANRDYDK